MALQIEKIEKLEKYSIFSGINGESQKYGILSEKKSVNMNFWRKN